MSVRSFFDTNVIVYSDDGRYPEKCAKAVALIRAARTARSGVISTQILQEYYNASIKKLKVDPKVAKRKVEFLTKLDVVQVNVSIILDAIDFQRLNKTSIWDALMVRAAITAGCTILYTEDLSNGQRFGGLQVVNPFM